MREQDRSHGRGGVLKKASVGTQHRKKQEDQPFLSRLDQKGVPVPLSIGHISTRRGEGMLSKFAIASPTCYSALHVSLRSSTPNTSGGVLFIPIVALWEHNFNCS